ncbi:TPA: hypothetical protein ACTVAL_004136 [Escherichia coli]|nr:hypothetical protein [Escherichia coli]MCM5807327.1 hypothetical protein [Escherichia coli]
MRLSANRQGNTCASVNA